MDKEELKKGKNLIDAIDGKNNIISTILDALHKLFGPSSLKRHHLSYRSLFY